MTTDWTTEGSEFKFRKGKTFFVLISSQTGSGTHPASYPISREGPFPKVRRPGYKTDHSPPTSTEVKKTWVYTSTPPYVFMA
jgi:hypothetical protein